MKIKKTFAYFKSQRGAALILMMMFISVILVTFIAMASLSLSQTVAHVARANAKVVQLNVAHDIGQALARAYALGRGACPANTTADTVGSVNFCFPNDGVTTRTGMNGICVDLDQDEATTHDEYCITTMTQVTKFDFYKEEKPTMVASVFNKLANKFNYLFLGAESANAQCTWFDCPDPTASGGAIAAPSVDEANMPGDYTTEPTSASAEMTGGTQGSHHTLERWFPTTSWSESNEIFTPTCSGASHYWLGCVDCTNARYACMQFTICPARNLSCSASERMTQGVAFY